VTAIHQFIPTLAPRDAIGAHCLAMQEALRNAGFRSDIYAQEAKEGLRKRARPFRSFRGPRAGEETWLLYHASVGSPVGDWLAARREPLLVDYHNITPMAYFARYEPHTAAVMGLGRRQLQKLAHRARLGLADSAYNAHELEELGYRATAVVPILLDVATLDVAPSPTALERLRRAKAAGGSDLLFVGRIAPNKAQHDLVKLLAAYRTNHDPAARLHLVGGVSSHGYEVALRKFVAALGLTDCVEITGTVTAAELSAYWATADVFVIASEHEGFNVPLLEAMHHRVPVVAYAAAAVPETLGTGGLALPTKDAATMAAAVARVLRDDDLRSGLVRTGTARLGEFAIERSSQKLLDAIGTVVGRE
jgi:glycosyltransferase involved in cell wall biosynthesis